jgi:hypothetical protein
VRSSLPNRLSGNRWSTVRLTGDTMDTRSIAVIALIIAVVVLILMLT